MSRVVTEPTFFWQTDLGLLGGLALVCPRCFFTFDVPEDWARDNEGANAPCPHCHLNAVIPSIPGA